MLMYIDASGVSVCAEVARSHAFLKIEASSCRNISRPLRILLEAVVREKLEQQEMRFLTVDLHQPVVDLIL